MTTVRKVAWMTTPGQLLAPIVPLGDGEHVDGRERGVQEGVGGPARPLRQRYAAERRRVILMRGPVAGT